jgi:hypothetical protein
MKRMWNIFCATAFLVVPCYAQAQDAQAQDAQTRRGMTVPEFRQTLVDLGTYLDAHKGTDLARQFSGIPDDVLSKISPAVPNPYQLQSAVAALKQHDLARAASTGASRLTGPNRTVVPNVVFGSGCPANSIIDNSPGAACTPAYPDPTNSAWQNLVNPIITFGAFSPTDYPDVSMQQCGLTVESNLVQVVSALNGTVTVAAIACGALTVIGQPICDGVVAGIGVAGAVSQGLLADCSEQDGNVNSAEIDAGFHNTVTIFNALGTDFTNLRTQLTNVNSTITNEFTAAATQLTNVNTGITSEFTSASNQLTAVSNQITAEFLTVGNQITQSNALLTAYLKQIMKLQLTPDGLKVIDPPILTCTGTNCPNVLAKCPAAGCSWNSAGPLP